MTIRDEIRILSLSLRSSFERDIDYTYAIRHGAKHVPLYTDEETAALRRIYELESLCNLTTPVRCNHA